MPNFSIGIQVRDELKGFSNGKVRLASVEKQDTTVRFLKKNQAGYFFNQLETLSLIDLYYNSKFENGEKDNLNQTKIFLNVGKFRSEVSSKQIDIDTKDFRFLPDDYSDPWVAFFLQKEFKEWCKDSYFGDLLNVLVEKFPKYGTVVLKEVGNEVFDVPLQNLRNEQTAESLQKASFVIEEHADMHLWEMQAMKGWNTAGLTLKYNETLTVYERYGHVPVKWLNGVNQKKVPEGTDTGSTDAMVIMAFVKTPGKADGVHIFFAEAIKKRPYREKHWSRQHGRWLGVGVMEDQIENQKAKNIIVNLVRRSLHWSAKRVMQSTTTDMVQKNLVKDVKDGEILEVGVNGQISQVDLSSKSNVEFSQFLAEFEKNSDQKAFTYEAATGEAMPSGTPFRLGVLLSDAVNSYFGLKREKLGLLVRDVVNDFLVPQFLTDMGDSERIISMFSDEPGFLALKDATMGYVRSEATRVGILTGKPVDPTLLMDATNPFEAIRTIYIKKHANAYRDAKYKFDLTVTGEEIDLKAKLQTLETLYQAMAARNDPRAEAVLERITALSGENMAVFGPASAPAPVAPPVANANPALPAPAAPATANATA